MGQGGVARAVPEELARIVREEIRARGPISFSRWMELCLYHPAHGYYMRPGRKTGAGRDADFVTPPTLHPFFGEAVAGEVRAAWERAGRPEAFHVVEFGGGEGDLARNALAALESREPRLAGSITWSHVDPSPPHREAQREGGDPRLRWAAGAPRHDMAVACEVVDAIPFDVVEFTGGRGDQPYGELEVAVGLDGEAFRETLRPTAKGPGVHPLDHKGGEPAPRRGERLLDQGRACDWLAEVCGKGCPSCILLVDYGPGGRAPGIPRAYRSHAPADPLADPGDVDLTGDVDFAALRNVAASCGYRETFETLEAFLLRHGILDALNAIDRSTREGASSYLRLRQLLLPTGMGAAFKVQRFDRA